MCPAAGVAAPRWCSQRRGSYSALPTREVTHSSSLTVTCTGQEEHHLELYWGWLWSLQHREEYIFHAVNNSDDSSRIHYTKGNKKKRRVTCYTELSLQQQVTSDDYIRSGITTFFKRRGTFIRAILHQLSLVLVKI